MTKSTDRRERPIGRDERLRVPVDRDGGKDCVERAKRSVLLKETQPDIKVTFLDRYERREQCRKITSEGDRVTSRPSPRTHSHELFDHADGGGRGDRSGS